MSRRKGRTRGKYKREPSHPPSQPPPLPEQPSPSEPRPLPGLNEATTSNQAHNQHHPQSKPTIRITPVPNSPRQPVTLPLSPANPIKPQTSSVGHCSCHSNLQSNAVAVAATICIQVYFRQRPSLVLQYCRAWNRDPYSDHQPRPPATQTIKHHCLLVAEYDSRSPSTSN